MLLASEDIKQKQNERNLWSNGWDTTAQRTKEWQLTHEVVVPWPLVWHHEEAKKPVWQQHLHTLVVRGEVTLGVVACVLVLASPLITTRGQLVRCQGAWSWGETEKKEKSYRSAFKLSQNKQVSNLGVLRPVNQPEQNTAKSIMHMGLHRH